jgi:hypothetical protein
VVIPFNRGSINDIDAHPSTAPASTFYLFGWEVDQRIYRGHPIRARRYLVLSEDKSDMTKECDDVEQMAQELGCNSNRITKELIESRITEVDYQTVVIAGQKLMLCGIKMDNGFVVVGKPATCIDPDNWRDEIGQKISYDNAFDEIWRLEAYRKLSDNLPTMRG